jgi:hypothetical protein
LSLPLPASRRTLAFELLLASAVVLFQELALIRWLPGQVRVVAYFPNLILLSAFLGLGVGCLRAGRRSLLLLWPPSLVAIVAAAALMSRVVFTHEGGGEHLFLLYFDMPRTAPMVPDIRPPLVVLFVLSAVSFVPLGQIVAERLRRFGDLGDPLAGYGWDIGGSIAGIAAFTLLSFAGTFPVVWFTVLFAMGAVFLRSSPKRLLAGGLAAACVLATVARTERAERYSPYYGLSVVPSRGGAGLNVLVHGALHQYALPLDRSAALADEGERGIRAGYHLPYRSLPRPPRRALVIGAGTGNDVAVLLDEGAQSVDAVEIDPVIVDIGRQRHPSRPYDSPRVRVFNADARTYLNTTSERYDLIVYGTLDSLTRLSALSSVRLDNFVYTRECLRAARSRLTGDGGLLLYFMVGEAGYIDVRLGGLLTEVFGETPLVISGDFGLFNHAFMAGPAFAAIDGEARRAGAPEALARVRARTELPSDDWPFLYLRERGITVFYATTAAALLLLSAGAVFLASGDLRRSVRDGGADVEMFALGLGFLLLETASVTTMNLVWGATWRTSAVVFLCVLATVLAAALVVRRKDVPYGAAVVALAASVLATYLLPAEAALRAGTLARLAVSLVLVGAPIFFGSICFSRAFAARPAPDRAFGWNILGAVAGGILEIASMATGLRALLLVALAAYLAAYWIYRRRLEVPVVRAA